MARTKVIVVVAPDDEAPPLDHLRDEIDVTVVRTADELRAAQPGVEILFMNHYRTTLLRDVVPGDLRWIHTSSIGVDALLSDELIASDVTVSITRGVTERPIAEWVLAAILMMVKDLRASIDYQQARRWVHRETEPLLGRRVLVLGVGGIGRETARLLRAAGMAVTVVGRTARQDPELGRVDAIAALDELLPEADDVVLALPLTAATRGLLDERRLRLMRSGARLINVGRGPLVVERDLLAVLRDGHLSGAALDVFDSEPLDPAHPFWAIDDVLVSPHMCGDLIGIRRMVVDRFEENYRRWQAGQPLANVVDLREQAAQAPKA